MREFVTNLKGNSFHFMCIITGAIAVVVISGSNPPMAYLSGVLLGWILVSILGVNIERAQAKTSTNK
ncbi:hypothetical protein R50072_01310 [Simiduia litorea]|uniref:hypothetical protein n=1 Tax=Simiduia litorea TaxID=1435348 RepID=UPI0036F35471